jgi:hypothetical protein
MRGSEQCPAGLVCQTVFIRPRNQPVQKHAENDHRDEYDVLLHAAPASEVSKALSGSEESLDPDAPSADSGDSLALITAYRKQNSISFTSLGAAAESKLCFHLCLRRVCQALRRALKAQNHCGDRDTEYYHRQ